MLWLVSLPTRCRRGVRREGSAPVDPSKEAVMRISRRFTQEGHSPYTGIDFELRTSEIKNPDGSTVFRQEGIAVPRVWSSVASDILAQKYFRKSGVPQQATDGKPVLDKDGRPVLGG